MALIDRFYNDVITVQFESNGLLSSACIAYKQYSIRVWIISFSLTYHHTLYTGFISHVARVYFPQVFVCHTDNYLANRR